MALLLHREPGLSWREAAIAQGRKHGMADDVEQSFDAENPQTEAEEMQAAWHACYEWDVLDLTDD